MEPAPKLPQPRIFLPTFRARLEEPARVVRRPKRLHVVAIPPLSERHRIDVRARRGQLGVGIMATSIETAIRNHAPDAENVLTRHRRSGARLDRILFVADDS